MLNADTKEICTIAGHKYALEIAGCGKHREEAIRKVLAREEWKRWGKRIVINGEGVRCDESENLMDGVFATLYSKTNTGEWEPIHFNSYLIPSSKKMLKVEDLLDSIKAVLIGF
jgi:hypothetical protein